MIRDDTGSGHGRRRPEREKRGMRGRDHYAIQRIAAARSGSFCQKMCCRKHDGTGDEEPDDRGPPFDVEFERRGAGCGALRIGLAVHE